MGRRTLLAATGLVAVVAGAQQFSVHDDLLAFPQFQLAFPDTFVLESDAQSKLDFVSSASSAKPGSQATQSIDKDKLPSVREPSRNNNGQQASGSAPELPQSYEYMVLDHTPYLCSIPQVEDEQRNETESATDEADDQKELDRARLRGSELIGAMGDNCLYYISGWWSYSFCYNSEVKQFHQLPPGRNGVPFHPPIEDESVPSYILGQYNGPKRLSAKEIEGRASGKDSSGEESPNAPQKATDLVEVQSKGNLKYLVQKLDDGTACDLTGKPRRIEVQYHCNPQSKDRISWIKETSTCTYLMVVYTSRLCDDVAFSPPQENEAHKIICQEILAQENVEGWKSRQAQRKLAELMAQGAAAQNARKKADGEIGEAKTQTGDSGIPSGVMIGGIELGGQKTVGMEGKRLEPPAAFKGSPKDSATKIDIIVQFDPKKNNGKWVTRSDKDLKKLGVDPVDAAQMAKEMYNYEKTKKWRIELAETPEGGELRGVIDDHAKDAKPAKDQPDEDNNDYAQGSEEEYFLRDEL